MSYTNKKMLPTTKNVKLIKKKKFVVILLNLDHKVLEIYIIAFNISFDIKIYFLKRAQIAHLKINKAFIEMPNIYTNFKNIFLAKLTIKLFKYTGINNHVIELVDNCQPLYSSIYSLGSMELKILKIYIKNNLTNSFIRPFKFPIKDLIFFN